MTTRIAAPDAKAMNELFAAELKTAGVKTAAGEDIEAFSDHKKYVDVLESVLSDDKKDAWAPNDVKLD